MSTFKAYFKKEILESIRQYRYVILAAGILSFAVLDPVMLKILPKVLEKQMAADLNSLIVITPKAALSNYIKDLTQIGTLVIIFTLSGILSDEIKSQKLVFPYSKASSAAGIVFAKLIHYTIAVSILILIGFITAFYYIGLLFQGEGIELIGVLKAAFLTSAYSFFNITLVIFFSSIFKKGVTAGFLVLIIDVLTGFLVSVDKIGKFMPYQFITAANQFSLDNTAWPLSFVVFIAVLCTIMTVYIMNKKEVI